MAEYALTDDERRFILLPNFGWLIEARLAGVGRPATAAALDALQAAGIRALISLSEAPLAAELRARPELATVHIPVADLTAPSLAQVEEAVAAIDAFLADGRPVAVSCGAGLGRTGTILACYLVRHGEDAGAALAAVRAKRPGSIETPEQEAIVAEYERVLSSHTPR
jgi:atypical dual specificity phosphatase